MSNPMVNVMVGTTAAGVAGGLGYGVYNKNYGVGAYGSNINDPYIGYSDYVIHGAALGAAAGLASAGLASAGLRYQAHQKKLEQLSEPTKHMLKMLGAE